MILRSTADGELSLGGGSRQCTTCSDGLRSILFDVLIETRAVRDPKTTHKEDLLWSDLPDVIDVLAIPAATVEVVDPDLVAVSKAHLLEQLRMIRHVETQCLQALLAKHLRFDAIRVPEAESHLPLEHEILLPSILLCELALFLLGVICIIAACPHLVHGLFVELRR